MREKENVKTTKGRRQNYNDDYNHDHEREFEELRHRRRTETEEELDDSIINNDNDDVDDSTEINLHFEELEEIKETVIQQLIVSYNLYKAVKEFYENRTKDSAVLSKMSEVVSQLDTIQPTVEKTIKKEINQLKLISYINTVAIFVAIVLLLIKLIR